MDHIVDNYYDYYIDKIGVPFVETVGVGEHSKVITKTTHEELLEFFRSDEALLVFSNYHELLAMANLYNITIHTFTYGGPKGDSWSVVHPDPKMVSESQKKLGKCIPDVALYHSYETHYDLLVKRDSRLALLGLVTSAVEIDQQMDTGKLSAESHVEMDTKEPFTESHAEVDDWIRVNSKKGNVSKVKKGVDEERLLVEKESIATNEKDLEEEITLVRSKQSGFRRTVPQESPTPGSKEPTTHKCMKCKFEFESDGILEEHKKVHEQPEQQFNCDICSEIFENQKSAEEHKKSQHKLAVEQWNCDDCSFQANSAAELMKHLKVTGHQPSKNVSDKRKVFADYKQCYTCKLDFDGFYNLMNHRKSVHPSSKKCRNFSAGKCTFNNDCWYVHGEENEDTLDNFKCDLCDKVFRGRTYFMKHKKLLHHQYVPSCEKFNRNKCSRTDNECWFHHRTVEKTSNVESAWPKLSPESPLKTANQVFHEVAGTTFPPDQVKMMMDMVTRLCDKVDTMEKKMKELTN